jgi:hypothetical protein
VSAPPLARLRYAGLIASVLLATGAYAVGALPGTDPGIAVRADPWQPRQLAGLAAWLAGTVLLAAVWWRGRREAPGLRWILVTGALWALPLLVAPPQGSRDVYAYACQGALYLDGHDPYAVGVAAGCPWLPAVPELWHHTPTPYGPLAVIVSAAATAVARAVPVAESSQLLVAVGLLRLVALAGILLVIGYGVRLARMFGVQPGPAVWLGAVTPLAAVHAIGGAHNDALLAGLVVAGLAVAAGPGRRAHPAAATAGVLLGLAVGVKVTALVAVAFALLLPVRHAVRAVLVAAAAAAFALVSVATGLGLGWVGALRDTGALTQWTSLPTGVGMAVGYLLRALGWPGGAGGAVVVARAVGLAVLVGLLCLLWLRARRRAAASPRAVVVACGAGLAALAVLSPVFYPWYALAPLAVLAFSTVDERVRRAVAVATVVLTFLVLPSGLGLAVLTKLPGALLDVALLAVLGARLAGSRRRAS